MREYKCPSEGCEFKGAFTKANLLIHYVRKHCSKEIKSLLDKTESAYKCTSCTKEMKSLTAFHYHCVKCVTGLDQQHLDELKSIQ